MAKLGRHSDVDRKMLRFAAAISRGLGPRSSCWGRFEANFAVVADLSGETSSPHDSAQKPAPSVGVSPIRPGFLLVSPPVLVATASVPHESMHTAPTVPWLGRSMPE